MIRTAFLLAALAIASSSNAYAMTVDVMQAKNGQQFVHAAGEIVPGDAEAVGNALGQIEPSSHNTKLLYLDSLGGSVEDALAMAEIIRRTGVTTVVPPNAVCASACASVVFISGKYSVVQNGGELIIHACYDAASGQKVDACDRQIADIAQSEGVSGRAMLDFENGAPTPDSGISFSASDARCYGLAHGPGQAALGDKAPCVKELLSKAQGNVQDE